MRTFGEQNEKQQMYKSKTVVLKQRGGSKKSNEAEWKTSNHFCHYCTSECTKDQQKYGGNTLLEINIQK